MTLIMQYIDTISSLFLVMLSQLGTIVVYDWNGEDPPGYRESFVDMAGGSFSLAVGASSGTFGWVDIKKCGNPFVNIMMTTYESTGVRNVEFDFDYGELINGNMEVVKTQRERSTEPLKYGPFVGIHKTIFDRSYGSWIRLRQAKNEGDALVVLQFRGSASFKPMPSLTTLDRDVEVV